MNGAGMIFQQLMQTSGGSRQTSAKAAAADKPIVFQNLLTNAKTSMSGLLNTQTNAQGNISLVNMLLGSDEVSRLLNNNASKEEVMQVLKGAINRTVMEQEGSASIEAMQKLEETIAKFSIKQDSKTEEVETENKALSLLVNMQAAPEMLNKEALQKQFEALFAKVEKLLSQTTDQKSILKTAPELLKLLEQWTALEKNSNNPSNMVFESTKHNGKEQTIWKELVHAFQKRNLLVSRQQYNTNAKVTSHDVAKWLQNALNNQGPIEKTSNQQSVSFTSLVPLSKVEQYVIHMNQNQNARPVDQQLIEQFQKVMKTSKFLTMQNGTSQLNITLRPENLGDMMVKLTQMNGEMTVKIIVTSTAAKEMLESNMHQLKNMFSPQQVAVEKQEVTSQQAQTNQRDQDEQPMDDHDEGQSDHSEQHDNPDDEEDFDSWFQKVLMNEEVS